MTWIKLTYLGEHYAECMKATGADGTKYYVALNALEGGGKGWIAHRVSVDGTSNVICKYSRWRWLAIRDCERVEAKR